MPSKVQAYAQMANHAATQITGSRKDWTDFLTTAARLYKYPYHEQLMIYVQRPNATACAEYDLWNNTMRRYVKRGSKGIALIDASGDKPRLRYPKANITVSGFETTDRKDFFDLAVQLHFMVNERERDWIRQRMTQLGTNNMGAYLRKMAIDGYVVRLDLTEIKDLISLLRRCSNNLNQLTRRAHETGNIYEADIEDLRQNYDRLWGMAGKILTELSEIR